MGHSECRIVDGSATNCAMMVSIVTLLVMAITWGATRIGIQLKL